LNRHQIINHLIQTNNYKSYLEIGVDIPALNYDLIKCQFRVGVDPNGVSTFSGTSDEFFATNRSMFDIVFIDGLHIDDQVDRDIHNSLRCLTPGGTIVLHDCLPINEQHQALKYAGDGIWAGTVWKSLAKLRMSRGDLELRIVDTDWCCGILRLSPTNIYLAGLGQTLDYSFYVNHREKIFDIISPEQFLKIYG
jgi:hypothetical protein